MKPALYALALLLTTHTHASESTPQASKAQQKNFTEGLIHQHIKTLLYDTNLFKRRHAALILRGYRTQESINALIAALEDEDTQVLKNVIHSLGELEAREATPFLTPFLDSKDTQIKIHTAIALGRLRTKSSVPALLQHIDDTHPDVRTQILWALGEAGDLRALEAIHKKLSDPHIDPRAMAARVLGILQSKTSIPLLEKVYYEDTSLKVRQSAAISLEKLEQTVAFPLQ